MNPILATKKGLEDCKDLLLEKAEVLAEEYIEEHQYANSTLHSKNKGYLRFRVREQLTKSGRSISISWYRAEINGSGQPRSGPINKGKKESVLLNNIRRECKDWEYELAVKYVKQLRPIEESLKSIGKMTRAYSWAIKILPVEFYEVEPAV